MEKINFNNHITTEDKRKFKGIWCDAHLWFYDGLNVMEKMFYLEIDSLDNERGCFASNDHFAKFSGLSKSRCSEIIKSLEEKGAITIDIVYKVKNGKISKQVDCRIIRIIQKWIRNIRNEYENQCDEIAEKKRSERKIVEPPSDIKNVVCDEEMSNQDPIRKTEGVEKSTENTLFDNSKGVFEKPKTLFGKPKDKEYRLKNTLLNKDDDDLQMSNIQINQSSDDLDAQFRKIFKDDWNSFVKKHIKTFTVKRCEKFRTLLEQFSVQIVVEALERCKNSEYLINNMEFDFFINEDNFVKILEGKYDNKKNTNPVSLSRFTNISNRGTNYNKVAEVETIYNDFKSGRITEQEYFKALESM